MSEGGSNDRRRRETRGRHTNTRATLAGCLLAGLFGLVTAGGYWFGASQFLQRPENPALMVDAKQLDFGTAWVQEDFQWTLPISNSTSQPIEIIDFRTSCSCTRVTTSPMVIPPASRAKVVLNLDLRPRNQEQAAQATRPFSVNVAAIVRDGELHPPGWDITGRVRSPFQLSQPAIRYRERLVRFQEPPWETVILTPTDEFQTVTASCDPAVATVELRSRDNANGKTYELRVQPSPELKSGHFEFPVDINATRAAGAPVPETSIDVTGVMADGVAALPGRVVLGALPLGATSVNSIRLASVHGEPFRVNRIESEPSEAGVRLFSSSAVKMHYEVETTVSELGRQERLVRFIVEQNGRSGVFEVPVRIVYHGLPSAEE